MFALLSASVVSECPFISVVVPSNYVIMKCWEIENDFSLVSLYKILIVGSIFPILCLFSEFVSATAFKWAGSFYYLVQFFFGHSVCVLNCIGIWGLFQMSRKQFTLSICYLRFIWLLVNVKKNFLLYQAVSNFVFDIFNWMYFRIQFFYSMPMASISDL